jgi:hypothetical protein
MTDHAGLPDLDWCGEQSQRILVVGVAELIGHGKESKGHGKESKKGCV